MSDSAPRQSKSERDADSRLAEALDLHERGALDQAEGLYRHILALEPNHFMAVHQLGVIQNQKGDHGAAVLTLEKAVRLNPRSSLAHLNLGIAHASLEHFEEALAHYQFSLMLNPGNAETLLNRGMALHRLRRLEEALGALDQALVLQPHAPKALLNRAIILQELHRPLEALASFDQALAFQPQDASAHTCRGTVLQELHRPAEALESHDRALGLQPNHVDALLNRGVALMDLDRPAEALESLDRCLALQPRQADALMNRGNALVQLRRLGEALESFDQSLALRPNNTDTLMNRGLALHLMGRHEDAIADLDRVLAIQPRLAKAHSAKIFMLDYLPDLTFERHQEERKRYFHAQVTGVPKAAAFFRNDRRAHRPLVVGYVSSDFKRHSAAASFWPVIKHHDKAAFHVICYSGVLVEDVQSRTFQETAQGWVRAFELSDEALAERIKKDKVDILVDLSGHSTGNRLPVFALKPAPIQVTAWGHSGGTGLPMMDYQFTDPVHIPAKVRPLFAEVSVDLPSCITFEPPAYAPDLKPLPALAKGYVTFGSLNRFSKITPSLLDSWARILRAVPHSRMLLKDGLFDDWTVRRAIEALFNKRGIASERLELRGHTSHEGHLAAYGDVDIVLDTFPQNGGITTWEALWMGAPVVAMLGGHPSCRISASILTAVGLGDWVQANEAAYEAEAIRRAGDLVALSLFRHGIRTRIAGSQAGNPARYTLAVEAAYRGMWERWLTT